LETLLNIYGLILKIIATHEIWRISNFGASP